MTIASVAVAARDTFAEADRVTMLAIAGAESAYNDAARGDNLSNFDSADRIKYAPFACADWLSFGPWQIFLGVWQQDLEILSGVKGSCPLANWLSNANNNAKAAYMVLSRQGFTAWSTYNNGAYRQFENEARAALAALPPVEPSGTGSPIVAISFREVEVHIDKADGSFDAYQIDSAANYGGWWRLEVHKPQ